MDNDLPKVENAVAAIRVSSTKQGTDGDSPEAQKEQLERFAKVHGITIKKFFVFMESASKEQQPMQEAIDYCKSSKNNIQLFVIKSIDRFTRGGSYSYDHLKMQLEKYGVKLVDIYGVIGSQKVNTLEHLGISFNWSVYSPTKKSELLEAERSKDELRDIMSRMIGAEIRYARMGYWVREAPLGYVVEKIETPNGKRCILKPHPIESQWIIKMFELRCRGTLGDHQIVEEINKLGFKTKIDYVRDPKDRTKIINLFFLNCLTCDLSCIITLSYTAGYISGSDRKSPLRGVISVITELSSVKALAKLNTGSFSPVSALLRYILKIPVSALHSFHLIKVVTIEESLNISFLSSTVKAVYMITQKCRRLDHRLQDFF